MRPILSIEEIKKGTKLIAYQDITKSVGDDLYCKKGDRLEVTEVFPGSIQACPEGKAHTIIGHFFVGITSIQRQLRFAEPNNTFASVAKSQR